MNNICKTVLLIMAILVSNQVYSQSSPVGDKPYYEVNGNVQYIELQYYNVAFNVNGQSFCKDFQTNKKSGENTVYVQSNDMIGDMTATYDASGKLLKHNGFEFRLWDLKYDSLDRLVSFSQSSGTEVYKYKRFYDENGDCVKIIENMYEDDGKGMKLASTKTYTYTILSKDDKGNWLKRKRNDGAIESRRIVYY